MTMNSQRLYSLADALEAFDRVFSRHPGERARFAECLAALPKRDAGRFDMTPMCLELVDRRPGAYCQLRRGHAEERHSVTPPGIPTEAVRCELFVCNWCGTTGLATPRDHVCQGTLYGADPANIYPGRFENFSPQSPDPAAEAKVEPGKCETCGGRGEVGGPLPSGDAQTDPCPACTSPVESPSVGGVPDSVGGSAWRCYPCIQAGCQGTACRLKAIERCPQCSHAINGHAIKHPASTVASCQNDGCECDLPRVHAPDCGMDLDHKAPCAPNKVTGHAVQPAATPGPGCCSDCHSGVPGDCLCSDTHEGASEMGPPAATPVTPTEPMPFYGTMFAAVPGSPRAETDLEATGERDEWRTLADRCEASNAELVTRHAHEMRRADQYEVRCLEVTKERDAAWVELEAVRRFSDETIRKMGDDLIALRERLAAKS